MYYLIVNNKDLFRDFIAKEANFYALISFDETDKQAVFDLLRRQFFQEHPQYPTNDGIITQYNVSIADDDGKLYYADLKSATFVLKGSIKPSVYFEQLDKLDASHAAAEQKRRKIKGKYSKNTLLRRRSLIPGYKYFSYFDAEYGIEIPFRFKKIKKNTKQPLIVFLHGAGALGEDNFKQFVEFKMTIGRLKQAPAPAKQRFRRRQCGKYQYIHKRPQQVDKTFDAILSNRQRQDLHHRRIIGWRMRLVFPLQLLRILCGRHSADGLYAGSLFKRFPQRKFCGRKDLGGTCQRDKLVPANSDINIYNRIKDVCSIKLSLYDQGGHRMMRAFYRKEQWQEWLFSQSKNKHID